MRRILTCLLLLLSGLSMGCDKGTTPPPNTKLRVGIIDTGRILQEMPEYKDLQSALVKERGSYLASLPKDPRNLGKDKFDQLRVDAQKKQTEWQGRVMEMMQAAVKQITELTGEVARARNLDLVVISTPYTANSIYFHDGQDITIDVMLKLHK